MNLKAMMLTAAAAMVVVGVASSAGATTYSEVQDIEGNTVDLSFTTNGAIGPITVGDITACSIYASGPIGTFDINSMNSYLHDTIDMYDYVNLTATLTTLTAVYQGQSSYLEAEVSIGNNVGDFCVGGDCGSPVAPDSKISGEEIGVYNQSGSGPQAGINYSAGTVITLGTVSAAPEPSIWALMIAGIGLIGATMRNRFRRSRLCLSV